MNYIGIHILAEFWGGKKIEDEKEIKKILMESAIKAHNTPLKVVVNKFFPQGLTAFILLAESHIALHTWPEMEYMAVDIFTCGVKTFPQKALEYLKEKFKPQKIKIKIIKRGLYKS